MYACRSDKPACNKQIYFQHKAFCAFIPLLRSENKQMFFLCKIKCWESRCMDTWGWMTIEATFHPPLAADLHAVPGFGPQTYWIIWFGCLCLRLSWRTAVEKTNTSVHLPGAASNSHSSCVKSFVSARPVSEPEVIVCGCCSDSFQTIIVAFLFF